MDRDIGEVFTFEEMFTKEYQPNDFTAKWLGGRNLLLFVSLSATFFICLITVTVTVERRCNDEGLNKE